MKRELNMRGMLLNGSIDGVGDDGLSAVLAAAVAAGHLLRIFVFETMIVTERAEELEGHVSLRKEKAVLRYFAFAAAIVVKQQQRRRISFQNAVSVMMWVWVESGFVP